MTPDRLQDVFSRSSRGRHENLLRTSWGRSESTSQGRLLDIRLGHPLDVRSGRPRDVSSKFPRDGQIKAVHLTLPPHIISVQVTEHVTPRVSGGEFETK